MAGLRPLSDMPGPKGIRDFDFIDFTSIDPYLKYAEQYGDLVHYELSRGGHFVLVSNADMLPQIYETPAFNARPDQDYISFSYGFVAGYNDTRRFRGLANDNSEFWKPKRDVVDSKIIPTYPTLLATINNHSRNLVDKIKQKGGKDKFDVEAYEIFRRHTFEIMGEVCYGAESFNRNPEAKEKFYKAVSFFFDNFAGFIPFQFPYDGIFIALQANKLKKHMQGVHNFLADILQHKRETGFGNDWISLIATHEGEHGKLGDDVIKVLSFDLFLGSGPFSFVLDYGLYSLSKFGFVQEKAAVERKKVMGDRDEVTAADLHNLTYHYGTAMELLRIYPAGGGIGGRLCVTDHTNFQGYDIPANTNFITSAYLMQRSQRYWNEPNNIDPLRWDPSVPKNKYAFVPLGSGAKGCPGKDFMFTLSIISFFHLMKAFDIVENKIKEPKVIFALFSRTKNPIKHTFAIKN